MSVCLCVALVFDDGGVSRYIIDRKSSFHAPFDHLPRIIINPPQLRPSKHPTYICHRQRRRDASITHSTATQPTTTPRHPGDEVIEWNGQSLHDRSADDVADIIAESRHEPQVEVIVSRVITSNRRTQSSRRQSQSPIQSHHHTFAGISPTINVFVCFRSFEYFVMSYFVPIYKFSI